MKMIKWLLVVLGLVAVGLVSYTLYYNSPSMRWQRHMDACYKILTEAVDSRDTSIIDRQEDELLAALQIAENFGPDDYRLEKTLHDLGDYYLDFGDDPGKAEVIYIRIIQIRKRNNDTTGVIEAKSRLGNIYQKQQRYEEAETTFKQNLQMAKSSNSSLERALSDLGYYYMSRDQWSKAEPLIKQCVEINENEFKSAKDAAKENTSQSTELSLARQDIVRISAKRLMRKLHAYAVILSWLDRRREQVQVVNRIENLKQQYGDPESIE